MLEVVDDALAVEKVHGGAEEVPIQRLGEAQAAGLAGDIGYGNDFLEADDLDGGDDGDDVEVASAEGEEEAANHDQGPRGADDEVCLFLLILALLGSLRCLETWLAGEGFSPLAARAHAYWEFVDGAVAGGAGGLRARLADVGHGHRGPARAPIAGTSMCELDVLARPRHG